MRHILLIMTILITTNLLSANSNVEIKVELSHVDCNIDNSKIYMGIYIRKTQDATQEIYLEHQNYRFNFNAQSLSHGSFFIESEGDLLSGVSFNPDGKPYFFSEHTINGSIDNILSYNIEFQGGSSGLHLQEDWINVGTIGATLLTNIECITSDILTISSFPSTTLVYTEIGSSDKIIDQDPKVYNLNSCIEAFCQACHEDLTLIQGQNNYVSGEILEHKVNDFIDASNTIGETAHAIYNAKNFSLLKAGFEVKENGQFEIKTDGCQN